MNYEKLWVLGMGGLRSPVDIKITSTLCNSKAKAGDGFAKPPRKYHKHKLAFDSVGVFIRLGITQLGVVQKKQESSKNISRWACKAPLFKASYKMEAAESNQRWLLEFLQPRMLPMLDRDGKDICGLR